MSFKDYLDEMLNEMAPKKGSDIESYVDDDGDTIYVIQDVKFTDNIQDTIDELLANGYEDFLYGELGSNEGITDAFGKIVYWGSDVQDHSKETGTKKVFPMKSKNY